MKANIKKLCCFYFPDITSKYYYFIIFVIASLLRRSIPRIISYKTSENNKQKLNPYDQDKISKYFDVFSNTFGDVLTGFVHCMNRQQKKDATKRKNSDVDIKYIYKDITKKNKEFFKKLLKISIIDFTCQLIFFYDSLSNKKRINANQKIHNIDYLYTFLGIGIIARYIISTKLLKTNFYFHHKLTFLLTILVIAIISGFECAYKIKEYSPYCLLISFIQSILYSFEDIYNKDAFNKHFILPATILFYKGICTFSYFLIFSIFLFCFDNIFDKMDFNKEEILYLILIKGSFIIFNIVRCVYYVSVIYFFSSQHISILNVLEMIMLSFYYFIDKKYINKNKDKNNYFYLGYGIDIMEIIACFILLFLSMIYNEVIIIDNVKMKEKTHYFLLLKADEEKLEPLDNLSELRNENESIDYH